MIFLVVFSTQNICLPELILMADHLWHAGPALECKMHFQPISCFILVNFTTEGLL